MAIRSLILTKSRPVETNQVNSNLRKNAGSQPVFSLSGSFDSLIIADSENPAQLAEFVTNKVRSVSGLEETATLVAIKQNNSNTNFEFRQPVNAFTFITTEPSQTENAFTRLQNLPNIQWAAVTTGQYNIGLFISASSIDELSKTLFATSSTSGIKSVETFIASK